MPDAHWQDFYEFKSSRDSDPPENKAALQGAEAQEAVFATDELALACDLPSIPPTECWRCGKSFSENLAVCPFCQARNRQLPPTPQLSDQSRRSRRSESKQLIVVLSVFMAMLLTGLIHGAVMKEALSGVATIDLRVATSVLHRVLVFEGIDTLLVVVALVMCGWVPLRHPPTTSRCLAAWMLALPLLGLSLLANLAYHRWIIDFTGAPLLSDEMLKYKSLFNLIAITYCIQPAIVEEVFTRYLFLGVLRKHLQTHGAVWVSALAFGILHIAVPLSIPYLIALGAVLGYLRVASGSMILPILFHFAHNLAVIRIELL